VVMAENPSGAICNAISLLAGKYFSFHVDKERYRLLATFSLDRGVLSIAHGLETAFARIAKEFPVFHTESAFSREM